ncbi:MAG: cysteine--tRNA ligase [Ignavibacteria bacterium]|nr:cysteine--tRNA ligase [Ignavibacteria bacterium]
MIVSLYNALSKSVQPVKPLTEGEISIYSCGPTVYNTAHIGNMRSFLFADILQRVMRVVGGYGVRWVMNITDIDDKTIADSAMGSSSWPKELGAQVDDSMVNLRRLTEYYSEMFLNDIARLGIERKHFLAMPRATDYIDEMRNLTQKIIDAGYGYVSGGSVYFNVAAYRKTHTYGRIFHVDMENFREGVRIDADEYDRDSVSDFVLWKARKGNEPFWDFTVAGENLPGRPGWHIECSAMSKQLLGLPFDVHTGGVDNRFPHHEDELAQCCAGYHIVEQATFWCHGEFLEVDGGKMSKSLNNFYTVTDLLERGLDIRDVRFSLISGHYRNKLNFTFDGVVAAGKTRIRIQQLIWQLLKKTNLKSYIGSDISVLGEPLFLQQSVYTALAEDLHMPRALAELFSALPKIMIAELDISQATQYLEVLWGVNCVLNVWEFTEQIFAEIPEHVAKIASARWLAKSEKRWADADALRDEIASNGFVMKDGKDGYTLEPVP